MLLLLGQVAVHEVDGHGALAEQPEECECAEDQQRAIAQQVRQRRMPRRGDYSVTFTDAQWARLLEIFPDGVCDWNRRGIGHDRLAGTWQSYD